MAPGAIILSRLPRRQCLVTLTPEWWVLLSYICIYFMTPPFRLLYTRQVVTLGRPLLIYMRTAAMRFVVDLPFLTTITSIASRYVRCDTKKSTQVAGPLTQVAMVLFITSSLVG